MVVSMISPIGSARGDAETDAAGEARREPRGLLDHERTGATATTAGTALAHPVRIASSANPAVCTGLGR